MRHTYFGKKLSRSTGERTQILRNLARDMILHGVLVTTKAKAKAVRSFVEKLVTRAKDGNQFSYRFVLAKLGDAKVVKQLMDDAKTRFSARTSGYTRILKLGPTGSDARELVQLSFVDPRIVTEVVSPEIKKENKKEIKKGRKTKPHTVKK